MNLKLYTKIKVFLIYSFFILKKNKFFKFILKNSLFSKSQVYQDLFVIFYSKLKKNGIFIEIGGGDGITISNTYLLEKKYKWKGIICEPIKKSQKQIKSTRQAKIEKRPIAKFSKKNILFYENIDPYQSSIKNTKNSVKKFKTSSISLNDLIEFHKLKKNIDYISIDTEGNELEIIENFDFKKYKVNFFSIEHNFNSKKRAKIFQIMVNNNFKRVYKYLSYMDDWYVNKNI